MGYRFSVFFVNVTVVDLVSAVRVRWRVIEPQPVCAPFHGFGFAFPDSEACETDEEAESLLEACYDAEDTLPEFSKQFPSAIFLWVRADCFGGTCLYDGFGCQNGEILVRVECAPDSLSKLVQVFGVSLGPGNHFQPFTCGFFRMPPPSTRHKSED